MAPPLERDITRATHHMSLPKMTQPRSGSGALRALTALHAGSLALCHSHASDPGLVQLSHHLAQAPRPDDRLGRRSGALGAGPSAGYGSYSAGLQPPVQRPLAAKPNTPPPPPGRSEPWGRQRGRTRWTRASRMGWTPWRGLRQTRQGGFERSCAGLHCGTAPTRYTYMRGRPIGRPSPCYPQTEFQRHPSMPCATPRE